MESYEGNPRCFIGKWLSERVAFLRPRELDYTLSHARF